MSTFNQFRSLSPRRHFLERIGAKHKHECIISGHEWTCNRPRCGDVFKIPCGPCQSDLLKKKQPSFPGF